jgi:hypothetical protein
MTEFLSAHVRGGPLAEGWFFALVEGHLIGRGWLCMCVLGLVVAGTARDYLHGAGCGMRRGP